MRFVALLSGGKDSVHCMLHCIANGHVPVVIGNLRPPKIDEMDSFMYQTVGHEMIEYIAEALNLPLVRQDIIGGSVRTDMQYMKTQGDEVEDLFLLLERVCSEYPDVRGVSCGALLSNYQRIRVEGVCDRLGLQSLSYLWQRKQDELLDEMIGTGMEAIAIKVACMGLAPRKHVGKSLSDLRPTLHKLYNQFGAHICGEGGEYESLVLDCPLYQKRIIIDTSDIVMHSDDSFAPVGYLRVRAAHLEEKKDSSTHPPPPLWSEISSAEDVSSARAWAQAILQSILPEADAEDFKMTLLGHTPNGAEVQATYPCAASSDAVSPPQPQHRLQDLPNANSCSVAAPHGGTLCYIAGLSLPTDTPRSSADVISDAIEESTSTCGATADADASCHSESSLLSIGDETAMVFKLLLRELGRHGMNASHVLQTHLYLNAMSDFAQINREYKKLFAHSPPARVCVATCLNGTSSENPTKNAPLHHRRFVLDCVAWSHTSMVAGTADGNEGGTKDTERDIVVPPAPVHLHVQGLSYWAPANIGPYSQSVTDVASGVLHMAGQIGLDPPTMALVPTAEQQSIRALQSLWAVMDVGNASLHGVITALCLVVDLSVLPTVTDSFQRFCAACLAGASTGDDNDDLALVLLPMVQFVQVAALPRNAEVEWHFVTCTGYPDGVMQTIPNVLGARTSQSALRYSLTAAHGYMWFDLDDSTMDIDLTEALRVVRDAVTLARSDVNTNGDDADVEGATINGDTLPASGGVRYVMLRIYASATTTMQSTVQVLVKDAMSIGMAVSVVPVVQLPNAAGVQCGVYFLL